MKTVRTALTVSLLLTPVVAMALPQYLQQFTASAHPKGALAKAACTTCHVGSTPQRNPFGKDIEKTMKAMKAKGITPAVLAKVANLDSDKDGVKNGVEIKKGTLPGDPKSK